MTTCSKPRSARRRPFAPALLLAGLVVGCSTKSVDEGAASGSQAASRPAAEGTSTTPELDPTALAVVLARAKERRAEQPTGASSLIGTRVEATAATAATSQAASAAPSGVSVLELGPENRPSTLSAERDLRATLYFDLVQLCRDDDGEILPPESIELEFRVDPRGVIDRSSVRATAARPEHEPAARCMVRVVRAQNGRFGPSRVELPTPQRVRAKVPSVD